jgi:hypothetical protein
VNDMQNELLEGLWLLGSFYEGPAHEYRGNIYTVIGAQQRLVMSGVEKSLAERIVQDHNALLPTRRA